MKEQCLQPCTQPVPSTAVHTSCYHTAVVFSQQGVESFQKKKKCVDLKCKYSISCSCFTWMRLFFHNTLLEVWSTPPDRGGVTLSGLWASSLRKAFSLQSPESRLDAGQRFVMPLQYFYFALCDSIGPNFGWMLRNRCLDGPRFCFLADVWRCCFSICR